MGSVPVHLTERQALTVFHAVDSERSRMKAIAHVVISGEDEISLSEKKNGRKIALKIWCK
jgi:hypothetical protein